MVARTQKEIRQQAPRWLVLILIAFTILMAIDARENGEASKQRLIRVWVQAILAPFERVSAGAGDAGVGLFQKIANLRNAEAENERLRQRLEQAEVELVNNRAAADENNRLKGLLGLKEEGRYSIVAARVIARDPSLWFNTVIIDRGSISGIENNMPVVTPGGIVGRVVAISPWTAQIMLVTDEKSGVGSVVGQLGASNALGSIKGLGENGLVEMRYVSGLEKVDVGDYVVTTGQDGIYPPNLNVGTVVEVKHGSATVPHVIHIKPGARIDQLEEVAVLLYHPPQRTAPEQALPNVEKSKKSGRK